MSYSFVYDLSQKIMEFVSGVIGIFKLSVNDLLGGWFPDWIDIDILNATLLDFLLIGGIQFIIVYSIYKWILPIIE